MPLKVVGIQSIEGKDNVIVESDLNGQKGQEWSTAIVELQGADARKMAVEHAVKVGGVSNARCEMPSGPYAIDKEGETVVNPKEQTIHRYRIDIPISAGLGL